MSSAKYAIHTAFISFLLIFMNACDKPGIGDDTIPLDKQWKIKFGDDKNWADPAFDDNDWMRIYPNQVWEKQLQTHSDYNGYAWYRIEFFLPRNLRKKAYFGNELRFYLGKIDDTEQTFLNGQLIGQNGIAIEENEQPPFAFENDSSAHDLSRDYILPLNDKRIRWGQHNTLAVRVHDHGGRGGMYTAQPYVSIVDVKDYLKMNIEVLPFELQNDNYLKTIRFRNIHPEEIFTSFLNITVTHRISGSEVYEAKEKLVFKPGSQTDYMFNFPGGTDESYRIEYLLEIENAEFPIYKTQNAPYILTPETPPEPIINAPERFGVRPGNPLLYKIPVSGNNPKVYTAKNLPDGVAIDTASGIISGFISESGSYEIKLFAKNLFGSDSMDFTLQVGNNIQLTPPMGWNSWNCWGLSVDDRKVREAANALNESGLIDFGWSFINIDDGWEASSRTLNGTLNSNPKFPDMKALSDYIHEMGLKIGIYASPGPFTCGGYLGSYGHEYIDARTWAGWGIDFLKYDWCSYGRVVKNEDNIEALKKPYIDMRDALNRVDRDIVYSLCQYGMGNVSVWGADVGGDLWRTTGDITDTWESLYSIGFSQHQYSKYAAPGRFNDPDMMILGWLGWGNDLRLTRLTVDEQYTHVSLWCLLSAPLLLGNDLTRLDDFTTSLLTNHEVLAVNQDRLCDQAELVYNNDSIQVWMKELSDGAYAAGIFNLDHQHREISIGINELGLNGTHQIRDLWRQKEHADETNRIESMIFSHGVFLAKITPLPGISD